MTMRPNMKKNIPAALARGSRRLLESEDGQGMTEFALLNLLIIVGGGLVALGVNDQFPGLLPTILNGFNVMIHGYYLVLGLPFP